MQDTLIIAVRPRGLSGMLLGLALITTSRSATHSSILSGQAPFAPSLEHSIHRLRLQSTSGTYPPCKAVRSNLCNLAHPVLPYLCCPIGIVLHELLHAHVLTGQYTVKDGPTDQEQGGIWYTYAGVSYLADNAASNNDAPLRNSQNYVFFAQAVTNSVAPAPCNCCSFGGPTISQCKGLLGSPACSICTCGGSNPNP